MLPGEASQTMILSAMRRAAHQLLDQPRIFVDPIAVGFVPEASEQAILGTADDHRALMPTLFRSLFAFRSRFAEERLAQASARGVCQYVIVGAGLDTFPWRQPDFAHALRIFYVDHPATLAWTRERIGERGLPTPQNLTFVAVDLEKHELAERLTETALRAMRQHSAPSWGLLSTSVGLQSKRCSTSPHRCRLKAKSHSRSRRPTKTSTVTISPRRFTA
jgi:methyltransferase (TIGR00027 family)